MSFWYWFNFSVLILFSVCILMLTPLSGVFLISLIALLIICFPFIFRNDDFFIFMKQEDFTGTYASMVLWMVIVSSYTYTNLSWAYAFGFIFMPLNLFLFIQLCNKYKQQKEI